MLQKSGVWHTFEDPVLGPFYFRLCFLAVKVDILAGEGSSLVQKIVSYQTLYLVLAAYLEPQHCSTEKVG